MNRLNKEAHATEEINGIKCAVVEKNVSKERGDFLKTLLEFNKFEVHVGQMPPPKVVPKPQVPPAPATAENPSPPVPQSEPPPPPELFVVGVTDLLFHAMLYVYKRVLKTPEGKLVSIAYWNQEPEKEGTLYWERRKKG